MLRFNRCVLLICIFLVCIHCGLIGQRLLSKTQLRKIVKEFAHKPELKSASISFALIDLRTGKKIATLDENRALVPASAQKIISCAIVLDKLKGDYKFITPFYLNGVPKADGSFDGNLEIIGKGDPSLASAHFTAIPKLQDIADTLSLILKRKGISKINGKVLVDESYITDVPENKEWLWYDLGNYYGAGSFAFNYAENQASISLTAANKEGGVCAILKVQPNQLSSLYTSRVIGKEQPHKEDVYVLGNSKSCVQEVLGEWRCCREDTLTIHSALSNPSDLFVHLLQDALSKNGVLIEGSTIASGDKRELIFNCESPMLKDLAGLALTKSINLYCESFLHQIGFALNGTTNRQEALIKLNQIVQDIVGNDQSVVLEDGSGLSPKNMISSSDFVSFLQWINKTESLNSFWQLLPDNVNQGPLTKWLKPKNKYQLNLRLKSGSMERVRSYCGFLIRDNKPVYALSLMINHYTCTGEYMNELIAGLFNKMLNSK